MRRYLTGAVIAGAAAIAGLSFRFGQLSVRQGEAQHEQHEAEAPSSDRVQLSQESAAHAGIKVQRVALGTVEQLVEVTGKVVPDANRLVKVGPLVSGRVVHLNVNIGDSVKSGQVLALVDSPGVAQARAGYREAEARVRIARDKLDNTRRLAEAGVFTQTPLDEARRERAQVASELQTARVEYDAELANAKATAATAQAAETRAQRSLELARSELERQRQLAQAGEFQYPPLQQAQREHADAVSDRLAAESDRALKESQLQRAERLHKVGTAAQKDVEAAKAAHEQARAALQRAQERERIAQQALERQRKIFEQGIFVSRELQTAETQSQQAQLEADQRRAELGQAQTRLRLAQSPEKQESLKQMETRLAALDSLLQRATGVAGKQLTAQRELQAAEGDLRQAEVNLTAARDALRVLHASPGNAASGHVPIVAPIAGRVLERKITRGQVVAAEGEMFTILSLDSVWADVLVYETDLAQVRRGQTVRAQAGPYPSRPFTGSVYYVSDRLDEHTRTTVVRCVLPNPLRLLKPEMSLTAQIVTGRHANTVVIPDSALQAEDDQTVVYVQVKEGQYERRPVRLGYRDEAGHRVEVLSGLKAGEMLVTEGVFYITSQRQAGKLAAEREP